MGNYKKLIEEYQNRLKESRDLLEVAHKMFDREKSEDEIKVLSAALNAIRLDISQQEQMIETFTEADKTFNSNTEEG